MCGKLPIDIIKGFPRNITKHTKRRRPDHSTNPCGKPSFFPSPLRGTVGVNTNLFRFPLPLEGAGGVNTIKSFRSAVCANTPAVRKVTYSLPLHVCTLRIRPSQSKQVPVQNKQRVGGGLLSHPFNPGGTPKAGTCSSERRARIVFHW